VAPELKRRIVETLMAGPVQARCGVHACDYPVPGLQPFPPKEGWAVRLVQCRTVLGLTQTESAHRIGVDPSALAKMGAGRAGADG
jgi:hypothetical protein